MGCISEHNLFCVLVSETEQLSEDNLGSILKEKSMWYRNKNAIDNLPSIDTVLMLYNFRPGKKMK